jgi:hypothetical protein
MSEVFFDVGLSLGIWTPNRLCGDGMCWTYKDDAGAAHERVTCSRTPDLYVCGLSVASVSTGEDRLA